MKIKNFFAAICAAIVLLCLTPATVLASGTVLDIADTVLSFNHTSDYDSTVADGTRFRFVAPSAGNYEIVFYTSAGRDTLFDYGSDSTYSSCSHFEYLGYRYTRKYIVKATAANQQFYLKIKPLSDLDYSDRHTVVAHKVQIVTFVNRLADGAKADSSYIFGDTVSITAPGNTDSKFSKWSVTSGSCVIGDTSKASTTLIVNGDCEVTASFVPAVMYQITTTPTSYSAAQNYYSGSASEGVRFYFVAPKAGGYGITMKGNNTSDDLKIYRYPTSAFDDYSKYKNFYGSYTDSVLVNERDTVFYIMRPYWTSDSAKVFNVSYVSINTYTVTLTSTSAHCSTSVKLDTALSGQVLSFTGYSEAGYRPNGWKVILGNGKLKDSTAYTISDTISTDTKYELQCASSKVYDITSAKTGYWYKGDFYEKDPSSGIRYRFEASTAGNYAVRFYPEDDSYLYSYGSDSSFYSYKKRQYASDEDDVTSYYVSVSAGEHFYFKAVPYSSSYYSDSVYVMAMPALVVNVMGKSAPDTVAVGDTLSLTPSLANGTRFNGWHVESGSGYFIDSTAWNAKFVPISDATIGYRTDSSMVYEISGTARILDYFDNGSKTPKGYGIRTVFNASDSGSYALVMSGHNYSYIYRYNDSTFTSYTSYNTMSSGSYKYIYNLDSAGSYYFFITQSTIDLKDTFSIRMAKTVKVRGDTTGYGYVYVGTNFKNYDSTYVAGDSIKLRAYDRDSSKFSHWERVSGSCTITDSTLATTYAHLNGDCTVRAVFVPGIIYDITQTPTEYTVAKNYFMGNYNNQVRFRFVAPAAGTYGIVTTRSAGSSDYFELYSYSSSSFSGYVTYKKSATLVMDSVTVAAGDTLYYKVENYYTSYDSIPFSISFTTSKGNIILVNDSHGTTTPSTGYSSIWMNVNYSIEASADSGYRFDKWKLISGSGIIADPQAKKTTVSTPDSAKIMATFKKGSVYELTSKEQKFSFMHHYYSDYTGSSIYFRWTAPDTAWRMISFVFTSDMVGTLYYYGTDSSYSKLENSISVNGNFQQDFKPGKKGKTYYWIFESNSAYKYDSNEFSALIATPYVLTIESSSKGYTSPTGSVVLAPGMDTLVYAIPYGGYTFNSWVTKSGTVSIDDTKSARTRMKPQTDKCVVEATYTLDFAVVPQVTINNLDLNNHPGVCAAVTVDDSNTGRAIPGLDSTDFVLYQDGKSLPTQITSVSKIGGVSVVLVVDVSGSMSDVMSGSMGVTKILEAKESIRQFINEMGPYDRTAIVAYSSDASVIQSMTSDKTLLLSSVDKLSAGGNTAINRGVDLGLDQLVGEVNSTAVIVFSDGNNNVDASSDRREGVIAKANGLNTTIYSIGIGNTYTDPLKNYADGTGGTYTYAPTAAELATIYSNIRSAVQARYVLCYNSPDAVLDGDTHQVVVKTTFMNKTALDTAYWDESILPPIVTLADTTRVLIGTPQPEDKSIAIRVKVSSKNTITSVYVYTRTSDLNSLTYVSHQMTNISDSTWSFVVPASSMVYPGIDFYVVATDDKGLTGKSPAVTNPSKEPYTIPVKNDAPKISSLLDDCIDTVGGQGLFTFEVTDSNGVSEAILYYRDDESVVFETAKFKRSKGEDSWLAEVPASTFVNSEVEFYVRALDKKGVSARWKKFKNNTISACRGDGVVDEVQDTIKLVNGSAEGESISRATESISATLVTENFTHGTDTALVDIECLASGDIENNLKMVEVSSGHFRLADMLDKDERNSKRNDGRLSCLASDTIVITYQDPLFGTTVSDSAAISVMNGMEYRFMDRNCDEDLDSITTSAKAPFCLVINTESPSIKLVDTLQVTLFTDSGDSLVAYAIETGKFTSEFEVKSAYFTFVSEKGNLQDSVLDAVLDFSGKNNRVKIQASVKSDKSKLKNRDSLIVRSDYVGAEVAEIYDSDLDGRADSIRIGYKKALDAKIESIDTLYWNRAGAEYRELKKSDISMEKDKKWVYAVLDEPFEYGKTAVDTSANPYLQLTKSKGDVMQKIYIEDHVGAVPVKAVKHPGETTITDYLDASEVLPPDTLVITLSEPIKNKGNKDAWKKLFRYSKSCSDTNSESLNAYAPVIDSTGMVWTFVMKDYNLSVENCITTNTNARYVDMAGNAMGRGGIEVSGKDGSVYLYEVAGNPTISGLDKNPKWISEKGKKWVTQPDSISSVRIWAIAPYIAYVTIYDGMSNIVTSFKTSFGYKGEMEQEIRGNEDNHYKVGFIGWNQKSSEGRKVSTGVYIWRIDFKFDDGHAEYRILKTGIKRKE